MEFAAPLTNLRTQLCVVVTGYGPIIDREAVWPEAAEEFLRRMNKLGVQLTIIGPRPPHKFGTKKNMRLLDRHEVVGLKMLAASKSHRLEFRILNSKTHAWTRLRAEACVTIGPHGVWPGHYEGWTQPGTLTLEALSRWVGEQKWIPGREFIFVGSSNRVLRWACLLLDRGVRNCYVVEESDELRCWRTYADRFVSKGGRILRKHEVLRVELEGAGGLAMYLANEQGTLILKSDTVVLAPANEEVFNPAGQWKRGKLFYVQRRSSPWEPVVDEERWFERLDWREMYWRVARALELIDPPEAEGALRSLRAERRKMVAYRKPGLRRELTYSGKILARESLAFVQSSPSVPRSFARPKPVASLECLEDLPCMACVDACPEGAIEKQELVSMPRLLEDLCTGCGKCVAVCPSGAAVMVQELPVQQKARYFLADDSKELWRAGKQLQLLNRKGDVLGTTRVISSVAYEDGAHRVLEVESTNVHLWEARGFRAMPGEYSQVVDAAEQANSPVQLKRSWVTLDGVRRLCPTDVPITVALWQLGRRRFEDALFCHDGGCRLCEVIVDGQPSLACKTLVRDGQDIRLGKSLTQGQKTPLCPCRNVSLEEYGQLLGEGASETIARELTGLGSGTCHGRWCLASCELAAKAADATSDKKLRPAFHGYETSPWRDIWTADVVEPERPERDDGL